MKNYLLSIAAMLIVASSYSQAIFNTGAIQVDVSEYGRIRLWTPDDVRHLQRASILVGTSVTAVFDYTNDAEEMEPTVLVSDPQESDFEIYGAYDNTFANLPPDVIVKLNAYGWTNGSYTVVKFNVESDEANSINAIIGLDIIPELNQEYGFDSVTYNSSAGVIRFHRGDQVNMGIKLLSHPLTSLYSFEWYDGYTVDEDYWAWMNEGTLQPQYVSNTEDGPVTITSQDAIALSNGQSVDVYYALALGADEDAMLENIAMAVEKYNFMIVSTSDRIAGNNLLTLEQNSPNPFGESTMISYYLPENGYVSLKVYDITGREVTELVNIVQPEGNYSVQLKGEELKDGLYFCTLTLNSQVKTIKISRTR
jgi:hypothetical protein